MPHDAELVAHQFPAYGDDPIAATKRAVAALAAKGPYEERYADFCRLMVYGESPLYKAALSTVQELAARLVR